MNKHSLAKRLTYAGTLPFISLVLLHHLQVVVWNLNLQTILLVYAAVIASFIAGIHWGLYLFKDAPVNLFIHSNIVALLAWVAALPGMPFGAFLLLVCFAYLLAIDVRLWKAGVLEDWFMRLRFAASGIVGASLLAHVLL